MNSAPLSPAPAAQPASPPSARAQLTAVVTGASSGIGRASALRLHREGFRVLAVARRAERLDALAREVGAPGTFHTLAADVSDPTQVEHVAQFVASDFGGRLNSLVNVAGGALGIETVQDADFDKWQSMFSSNVLGSARMTKALLPALIASGRGDVLFLTSTAAQVAYEGGSGYNAAKSAEHMVAAALRLEIAGEPVRVIEIAPGMVHTEEFSLTRLGGDQAGAQRVYDGVENPLTADDVADVIAYALTAPHHVNLDLVTMRPLAQAAQHKLVRRSGS